MPGERRKLAAVDRFVEREEDNREARIGAEPVETVSVVGCLCTPLDLLGDAVELPDAGIGDLVVLFQAGAYGLTGTGLRSTRSDRRSGTAAAAWRSAGAYSGF